MNTLFVYGTLRRGEINSFHLDSSRFLGMDRLPGFVIADLGEYPMAFETGNPEDSIAIEIYEVNDSVLRSIDILEDCEEGNPGSMYNRKLVTGRSGTTGFVYYGEESGSYSRFPLIAGGDWKER